MFPLRRYRSLTDLGSPASRGSHQHEMPHLEATINDRTPPPDLTALHFLYKEYHGSNTEEGSITLEDLSRVPFARRKQLIRSLLTLRPASRGLPPSEILDAINVHLQNIAASNPDPLVPIEDIRNVVEEVWPSLAGALNGQQGDLTSLEKISLWRGNITRLQSDRVAIVNAANTRMLGCFQPQHLCIDNVIHAAAGPRLRHDCYKIVTSNGAGREEEADVGEALLTKGHLLPAGFVLHVAGPQIHTQAGEEVTVTTEEEEQLAKAYTSCLDLAEESGMISAVAFPCISTGLFAFPAPLAASIALRTTLAWLDSHPASIIRPLFVLFSSADAATYVSTLATLFPSLPLPRPLKKHVKISARVRKWISESDSIILHAGAGLSADAVNEKTGFGLDYNSRELFAKLYPGLLRSTNMKCLYHSIGYEFEDPLVKWAYTLAHASTVLSWGPTPVYTSLLSLLRSKSTYTVCTSNADQLFVQSGFDPSRVWTPQGTYGHFQCLRKCTAESYFDVGPWVERAKPFIDRETMRLPEGREDLIPECDKCGSEVFLNVRGGDWFNDRPQRGQRERYQAQVAAAVEQAEASGKSVVLLEIGAGFNTPGVVRYPGEQLVEEFGGTVKLIRINLTHPEIPEEIKENAVGLKMGIMDFLEAIQV